MLNIWRMTFCGWLEYLGSPGQLNLFLSHCLWFPCHIRVDEFDNVKVADFGLSRDLYSREYYRTENAHSPLPIRWMALECLERNYYSSASDVVSFYFNNNGCLPVSCIRVSYMLNVYNLGHIMLNRLFECTTSVVSSLCVKSERPSGLWLH